MKVLLIKCPKKKQLLHVFSVLRSKYSVKLFSLWFLSGRIIFQESIFVTAFHLRADNSGGGGQFKGGEGVIRRMKFREPITLSLLTERRVLEPKGLAGGGNAKCGENILIRSNSSMLFLGPKTSVEVKPGETLLLKTPGGGGYGDLDCGENCHVNEKIDVKLTKILW